MNRWRKMQLEASFYLLGQIQAQDDKAHTYSKKVEKTQPIIYIRRERKKKWLFPFFRHFHHTYSFPWRHSLVTTLTTHLPSMAWDLIVWLIALASNIALLGLLVYQIICLSDLEADYMNPYESSTNINSIVLIEFILQGAFSALFLLTGHWFMFLVTMPLACYHIRLFLRREHLIDVTEIFRTLGAEKKFRMIKLAIHLVFFFLVIVRLVISIYNAIAHEDDGVDVRGFWLY